MYLLKRLPSLKGYKKLLKENPELAARRAERIIKNTYRTLLTRGQKGCYVFCTDPETNEYFKSLLPQRKAVFHEPAEEVWGNKAAEDSRPWGKYPGLPLKVVDKNDVIPFVNAVPVFDLSNSFPPLEQAAADKSYDWVSLPEYITCGPDFFVVPMVGESMNKRIADGTWCLFKKTPAEKSAGEIVLAYHPDIYNTDGSGCYAIRRYWPGETVLHEEQKVLLQPETRTPGYADIEIAGDSTGRLEILGKFVLSF